MPLEKDDVADVFPCSFYEPAELLDPDLLYTAPEIARLLQGLDPDASLDPDTESVLLDWAIPWILINADALVVAEPPAPDDPGYFGLAVQ